MATEKWEEPLGEQQKTWYGEAHSFLANFIIVALKRAKIRIFSADFNVISGS